MALGLVRSTGEWFPQGASSLILGKPRTGKTSLLVRLALHDIHDGKNIVFIDPSGTAITEILNHIPKSRKEDVLLISPAEFSFGLNFLENIPENRHALFANTITESIKGIYFDKNAPTALFEQTLRQGINTLLKVQGSTLLNLLFLLTDKRTSVKDTLLTFFWDKFEEMSLKDKRQEVSSTANKLWAFFSEPRIRDCVDQPHNFLSFNKVVLVSLNKGQLGTQNVAMLGSLILSQLYLENPKTTLYVDGANLFGNHIIPAILSDSTNVETHFTLQSLRQVKGYETDFMGVEQIVAFRSSVVDEELLAPEFNYRLDNSLDRLYEIKQFNASVAVDGKTTELEMPLHTYPKTGFAEKIILGNRTRCSASREKLDQRLGRFF
jgi:hypothetical protein